MAPAQKSGSQPLLPRYARLVVSRPWLFIGVTALVVAIFAALASQVSVRGAGPDSYPQSSELTKQLLRVEEIFGASDSLYFTITSNSPEALHAELCRITRQLETIPEVTPGSVLSAASPSIKLISLSGEDLVVRQSSDLCDAGMTLKEAELAALGPQRPALALDSGAFTIIADVHVSDRRMHAFFESRILPLLKASSPEVLVSVTGGARFLSALEAYSDRIGAFLPFVVLVIGALHFEVLRSWQAVFIPLATGLLATVVMVGLAAMVAFPLDEYTSTAPILILAVAAGHSVQLLKRYMEEAVARTAAGSLNRAANRAAVEATIVAMAPVLGVAVSAAAACLLVLSVLDVPAISQFGQLAAVGFVAALALELSFVPALRCVLPPPRVRRGFGDLAGHWSALLKAMARASRAPLVLAVAVACATVALLALGASRIMPSHSLTQTFASHTPEIAELNRIVGQGAGPFPLDAVIDTGRPGAALEPATLTAAAALADVMRADANVAAVISPVDSMRFLRCKFDLSKTCEAAAITSVEEASQIWTILGGDARSILMDPDSRHLRIRALLRSDETGKVTRLNEQLVAVAHQHGLTLLSGGIAIAVKSIADGVSRTAFEKVAIILAVTALLGLLVFRSVWAGLLFMIPSAFTALATYGALGWSGTPLNVATSLISALAIGVGADYLIYFTFRLREALAVSSTWDQAMAIAYRSAGGASLCVATAVAGGYLVLVLSSDFLVHQWLGVFIPLAMIASLIGALVIYPFALNLIRPRFLVPARTTTSPSQLAAEKAHAPE